MPANKYGKSLYKAGTVKSEKAAIANRDPARKKAAEKIMKREGTTSPAAGVQRLRCCLKLRRLKSELYLPTPTNRLKNKLYLPKPTNRLKSEFYLTNPPNLLNLYRLFVPLRT
jgi:hypothetical protein